jgi:hypothetical protein
MLRLIALGSLLVATSGGGPPSGAERELLERHAAILEAHRHNDARAIVANHCPDLVLGSAGSITRPSAEQMRGMLEPYLSRTRFSAYEDLIAPIARVSPDGRLGWVIVLVHAKGRQRDEKGAESDLEFVSAWVELYEKRDGRWCAAGNVSNFKPPERVSAASR